METLGLKPNQEELDAMIREIDEDGNGEDGYDEGYDEENLYYEGGYDEEADVGAIDDDDLDLEEMMNIAIS